MPNQIRRRPGLQALARSFANPNLKCLERGPIKRIVVRGENDLILLDRTRAVRQLDDSTGSLHSAEGR